MELGFFLLELIAAVIDALCIGSDLHAWFKGRANRGERREARKAGLPPPPRDRWNRRVIVLSLFVVLLTGFLVVRLLRRNA